MDLNLKDKIVLITGGSKGLGRAIAHRFASEGCHLHLVARTQETLDEAANALRQQFSVKVGTFAIDLAQRGSAQRVAETCGDVDILVNNAGDVPCGSLEAIEEDRWRAGWDTKVFNYINLSREYFRRMRARRSGVIVNLTGIGGDLLDPSYIAGGVGNAAMAAFTKSLGSNSHQVGVRVVGINPGPCATERFERLARAKAQERYGNPDRWHEALGTLPFGRPATPDEIAAAAVFLASPLSGYTTGAILTIDGGVTGGRFSRRGSFQLSQTKERMMYKILAAAAVVVAFGGLSASAAFAQNMTLTSAEVADGSTIKDAQVANVFGCKGGNISPSLSWSGAPSDTKSFAITVYDPDAPTGSGFWHWVVFNIPASTTSIPVGAGDVKKKLMPKGAVQSRTDFGTDGYGGPCPPQGDKPHHYIFTVYAVDEDKLQFAKDHNVSAAVVGFELHFHSKAKASLTATYGR